MMMTMMIMPVSKTTSKENLKPNCYCGQLDPFCMGKNIWLTTTNLTFVWMTICCWPFSLCFGFGLTHLVWFKTKSRSRGFAWHQSSEFEFKVDLEDQMSWPFNTNAWYHLLFFRLLCNSFAKMIPKIHILWGLTCACASCMIILTK